MCTPWLLETRPRSKILAKTLLLICASIFSLTIFGAFSFQFSIHWCGIYSIFMFIGVYNILKRHPTCVGTIISFEEGKGIMLFY
jgi:hypothetical protein